MTSSVYPGALDNDANLGRVDSLTAIGPADHNNLVDSIEAIEATLGVNPQGASATVAARIAALGGGGGGTGDAGWTAATLVNSWVAYGGTYGAPAYRRDGQGVVHLRGLAKDGNVGLVIFTLPAGYRPIADTAFAAANTNGPIQLAVRGNGEVQAYASGGVSPGNAFQGFDGVSFFGEA